MPEKQKKYREAMNATRAGQTLGSAMKDKSLMFQECTIDLLGWYMDFFGGSFGTIVHPLESSGQVTRRC